MTTAKVISLGFLSIGIFVLMQVVLPLLSFQFWEISHKYESKILNSPKISQNRILGVSIETKDNFPAFVSTQKREKLPYLEFRLSISKIKLMETNVYVDSNDLSKGLVHLPGTALPGERGNVFISGHSALSNFWSKQAFFARLPDIKTGDRIEIDANGAKFAYQVIEMKIIDPTDISIIAPPDDKGRYISLMTCVPPGLNFKRLVVLGKMI